MRVMLRRIGPLMVLALAAWVGMQSLQGWTASRVADEVAARAQPGDIVMLSSLSCGYCAQARAWFTAHRVPFSECFIERDADCAARYNALQSPGTPMLLVRGQRQVGFSAEQVAQALKAAG